MDALTVFKHLPWHFPLRFLILLVINRKWVLCYGLATRKAPSASLPRLLTRLRTAHRSVALRTLEISCLFLNAKAHHLSAFLIDKEQACIFLIEKFCSMTIEFIFTCCILWELAICHFMSLAWGSRLHCHSLALPAYVPSQKTLRCLTSCLLTGCSSR